MPPPESAAPTPPDVDDPRCGKCGYCVRGVPSFTCPECGSDLRAVGIVTRTTHPRITRTQVAALWTVAVVICVAIFSRLLTQVLPTPHVTRMTRTIFSQSPPLQTMIEADCSLSWFGWGTSYRPGSVPMEDVTLRANGSAGNQMVVNWRTKAYRYTANGQTVQQPNGFGPDALLTWLYAVGVKAEDPGGLLKTWNGPPLGQAAAERIQQIIDDVDAMPHSQGTFSAHDLRPGRGPQVMIAHPSFIFTWQSPWTNVGLGVFWTTAWLVGLWRIFRRRREPRIAPAPT